MKFEKERNFIVASNENGIRAKWNILTNEYTGVKGTIVQRKPRAFLDNEWEMPDYVRAALRLINCYNNSKIAPYTPHKAQRLESLISLGIEVYHSSGTWSLLETDDTKLSKQFVDYLKENYNGRYSVSAINDYNFYCNHINLFSGLNEQECAWAKDLYLRLRNLNEESTEKMPEAYCESMIRQTIREKLHVHHSYYDISSIIYKVYIRSIEMGDVATPFKNILTYYAIHRVLYEDWRNNNYDALLKLYNDKPWLYYENDTFIAYPLLTRKDFHNEAHEQSNCVERMYMEPTSEGKTHVVVIRLKENPTESFITCEVDNRGFILQYLYSHNRNVTSNSPAGQFRKEYSAHLKANCTEK